MLDKTTVIAVGMIFFSVASSGATYRNQDRDFLGLGDSAKDIRLLDFDLQNRAQQKVAQNKASFTDVVNLIKEKKYAEAKNAIDNLIKNYPEQAEFYNLKALLATTQKNTEGAIKAYKKALQLDPFNLRANLSLAKIYLDENNLKETKHYINQSLKIDDKAVLGYFLLADIAIREKQPNKVESILTGAMDKMGDDSSRKLKVVEKLSQWYLAQKNPQKFLSLTQKFVRQNPEQISALSLLASAQLMNGLKSEAEKTLSDLINKNPQDIPHRLLLVKVLMTESGKEQEIDKILEKLQEIAPNNPDVIAQLAVFQAKQKKFAQAHKYAQQLEELLPEQNYSQLLHGDIYVAENRIEDALSAYQAAYEKKPNEKLLLLITDMLVKQQKTDDAIKMLEKARKNNQSQVVDLKLAILYQQQERLSDAELLYQAMLKDHPENPVVLNNLAWIFYKQNRSDEGLKLIEKAVKLVPESSSIQDTYGMILLQKGVIKDSIRAFEKAHNLSPDNHTTAYHLAKAYAQGGEKGKALKILEKITETGSEFTEKKGALELLKELKESQ